jgi:hypothetical protein
METFNLTPPPAFLDALGRIPFKGWQCIAELIDNSIDAIINNDNKLKDYQKVISVYIPTKSKIALNEPLVIEDWSTGMSEKQLENAVQAGFSNKATDSNLGLFGMGFNVATSKLAYNVQVWTSKTDMDEEIGVCIDLREMKKSGSYTRPKMTRPKRSDKISGTRIEIYDYKPEASLILQPKQIYRELNRAYSDRIFEKYGIKIFINNEELKPFKFCVWDKTRSVRVKYDEIPVIYEINEHLKEEMFCENCLNWIGDAVDTTLKIECPFCTSTDRIVKKNIYVSGWVGIQRFSDTEHFGIDISRNGRVLSKLDKTLFHWDNENAKDDPRFHPEYPRDTTYAGGRIVGQIEANFLVPNYTKDDFERGDKNWKKVVTYLRGEMPFQPDLAAQYGYKMTNRSPIGMLYIGYKSIKLPGSNTLVFARENGSVDHVTPKNWAQKFYDGDPEFQSDNKWWEAVTKANFKETPSPFNPLNPTGRAPLTSTKTEGNKLPPQPEKFPGKKLLKKTLHFDLEKLIGEKPIALTLIDYYPENDLNIPIIFESQGTMWKFNVYLNNNHAMFRDFADGYEDLIYMEVASIYSQAKNKLDEWTVTRIYYELKSKYALATMLSVPNLVSKASKLTRDIQNKLVNGEGIQLDRKPNLRPEEETALRKKYLDLEGKNITDLKSFILNTKFLKYLDLNYIFKFVEEFPDVVYDGKIFNLPYMELDDESKQHQAKKYSGYFSDVRWFMNDLSKEGDEAVKKLKQQIIRNRYSIEILDGSINK